MLVKIPVEIVELDDNSFHLFVAGSINGLSCNFIIDTGASKTVFALNYIQNILDEVPAAQPDIQSAGITASNMNSHSGVAREFRLGNLVIFNMNIILIDLSSIDELYRKFTDKTIWGLIGSDILLQYKATLDYGKQTLCLRVPKANFLVL
jgi:hypothetical protein